MGRRKTSILHEGEGLIRNVKWAGDMIAWSNDKGVKIYSLNEKKMIAFITKDHDSSLRDELYKCSLLWPDQETLVIGWADRFKICKVIKKYSVAAAAAGVPHDKRDMGRHVEISNS